MTHVEEGVALEALERLSSALSGATRMISIDEGEALYIRHSLLIASARKVVQQVEAILVLARGGYYEEVAGVARVVTEVVINAIYLQYAREQEVESFLHFDSQKINARLLRDYLSAGDVNEANSAETTLAGQRFRTGQLDNALSWCSLSLAKRAVLADKHEPIQALALLQDMSSRLCNFALHGTFMSLAHLLPVADAECGFSQRLGFYNLGIALTGKAVETLFQFIGRLVVQQGAQATQYT